MKKDEVAERGNAAPVASAPKGEKKKNDGKKEDAYEMAVGYTKEGDFSSWYSDVSIIKPGGTERDDSLKARLLMLTHGSFVLTVGLGQGRHVGLLRCFGLLHPETLVIHRLAAHPE